VSNRPNTQPIDLPNSNGDNLLRSGKRWRSRHRVRRNFADRFRPIARRQNPNLFCELVNIAQRLNSRKIHVTPPTHQHAIADVMIVQMSQHQKNL
jgi:hypothetical protein